MNLFGLVWCYLKSRPLNTAINIILLSMGIAVITLLLLFNRQLEQKIADNTKGIDLVIGAKGSPLQLILCNIFHIDFPTGNIKLYEAEKVAGGRLVKRAIPLALGDSYRSYRIVGTTKRYLELYNPELASGSWWSEDLEVTLGATVARITGLRIGDRFVSAHGLNSDGHAHSDHQYVVSSVMKPTGGVIDNLILTNVESIWAMHEEGKGEHDSYDTSTLTRSLLVPSVSLKDSTREITALLIQYRSALAAIQLPRIVNSQSSLQAASPAFETARLFTIMGVGVDILMAFAYVLIVIASLSIFIALYNSLKERRYDMAIMRSMGASRSTLLTTILMEGSFLTLIGSVTGLLMGHGVMIGMSLWVEETQKAGIHGYIFYSGEWIILGGSLFLGIICSAIPAVQAYRTDISKVLAGNQ